MSSDEPNSPAEATPSPTAHTRWRTATKYAVLSILTDALLTLIDQHFDGSSENAMPNSAAGIS